MATKDKEPGSDDLLADAADRDQVTANLDADVERRAEEEQRLTRQRGPEAGEDPGTDHPDADEAPPADEDHGEHDVTDEDSESRGSGGPGASAGRTTSERRCVGRRQRHRPT